MGSMEAMADSFREEPKTIRMQENSAFKHFLPKTKVHHAILHENVSQERHLQMKLDRLKARQNQAVSSLEQSRRSFLDKQTRKKSKWRQQDDMRMTAMTLPHLNPDLSRRPSMRTVYQSPRYPGSASDPELRDVTLLPFMRLRRERTEIVQHHSNIFLTRLPTLIEVDSLKLRRYNTFCGSANLHVGKPLKDHRFRDMLRALCPSHAQEVAKDRTGQDGTSFFPEVTKSALVTTDERTAGSAVRATRTPMEARVVFPVKLSRLKTGAGGTTRERLMSIQNEGNTYTVGSRSIKSGAKGTTKKAEAEREVADQPEKHLHTKQQIQQDLQNKSLQELKGSYGKLRPGAASHGGATSEAAGRRMSLAGEDLNLVEGSALQLINTVKSHIK